jgi:hypothetical protein
MNALLEGRGVMVLVGRMEWREVREVDGLEAVSDGRLAGTRLSYAIEELSDV